MATSLCEICVTQASRYKCPTCEMRYCSLTCYKPHKATHTHTDTQPAAAPPSNSAPAETTANPHPTLTPTASNPSTRHRPAPPCPLTASDPLLTTLLSRYPLLKPQLQLLYGLTLEPGPDETRTWHRDDHVRAGGPYAGSGRFGGGGGSGGYRGRGGHGRGRGFGYGHGQRHGYGGQQGGGDEAREQRPRGPWTQGKGDALALEGVRVLRSGGGGSAELGRREAEMRAGMEEFVQLCLMRAGDVERGREGSG